MNTATTEGAVILRSGGVLLRLGRWFALSTILFFAAGWALGQTEPVQCVLLTVEGKVEVRGSVAPNWTEAKTNTVLLAGDQVRTGFKSRATLQWSDLSVVRVKALTTLEVRAPSGSKTKPELDVKSGATYFFSREKPEEIQFRTPVASGAIRGTEFQLAVDEATGKTELSLLDGEVLLASAQGESELTSGELGIVEPGQAPTKVPLLNAISVIQWVLYYPVILYPDDLAWTDEEREARADSLAAYRAGDLLAAAQLLPEAPLGESVAARTWRGALLLAVGEASAAREVLQEVAADAAPARALLEMLAAVQNESVAKSPEPATATEWMARSYVAQAQFDLEAARRAAGEAVQAAEGFGAAWIRLAELEFSFGRVSQAEEALDRGLALAPRHAPGLALRGFLAGAKQDTQASLDAFEQAIALNGGFGEAWLGRGLVKIRRGNIEAGRQDLQVAAALEPQRSVLRSYLGKAFQEEGEPALARKEIGLARELDPNDPTPWLYSALVLQQENRVNEAIKELETSRDLNDNRALFRSRLLLDQDRAVRSANLASIYRDAGMDEVGLQEAARAVADDYANYSAHLFLANSYQARRDPKLINLRYEAPWFSELLVSQLLGPPGGGTLSRTVSQQDYTQFFEGNRLGGFSSTEYFSSGDWIQNASQFGVYGNSSYALDAYYRTENGQRPNNDLEQLNLAARFKQQITPQDSVLFDVSYFDAESGDVAQYYNQNQASRTLRVEETQEPNLLLGYHREWNPGSHTLFLAGRFDDELSLDDSNPALLYQQTFVPFPGVTNRSLSNPQFFSLDYVSDLEAYSTELQHFWQTPAHTFLVGGRYQIGWNDTDSVLQRNPPVGTSTRVATGDETELYRLSIYAYEHWQVLETLRLTAGVSYDRLHYPVNIDTSPVETDESSKDRVSPKAGFVWSPLDSTHFRGAYTRSLGGVFFDTSVRLEPTQINGFNQTYRSLIPESVVGLVPGTVFETFSLGWDQEFSTRTYLTLETEWLESEGARDVGLLVNGDPVVPSPDTASSTRQSLDFRERSARLTLNQLVGRDFSVGTSYRLTDGDMETASPTATSALNQDVSATLHQVYLFGNFNHPSGFFAQVSAVWSQQSNRDYEPDIPGDDFWQLHAFVGYRVWERRLEARLGVMNLTDQNYRLNPLTLYQELPRERTLVASCKIHF